MNRIRQIRESLGVTADDLAEQVGTTGVTIRRLETGARKLTVEWMQKIAAALGVSPSDLLESAALAELQDDVVPSTLSVLSGALKALEQKNLRFYRVTGDSVIDAGIAPGADIVIDHSSDALSNLRSGDIVLCTMRPRHSANQPNTTLRIWIAPDMVVTNRPGGNLAVKMDDPSVETTLCGVRLRDNGD